MNTEGQKPRWATPWMPIAACLVVLVSACGDDGATPPSGLEPDADIEVGRDAGDSEPDADTHEPGALDVVVPASTFVGLGHAADDLLEAFATIRGGASSADHIVESLEQVDAAWVVVVEVDPERTEYGEQGYAILERDFAGERAGLEIRAATPVGAMYGVYDLIGELGVRYYHPERTYYPSDLNVGLPVAAYDGVLVTPSFDRRGFHEHTQHPTVMSDFLLRPGDPEFRSYVSHYLRWLARNRQNVLSFHTLKTIDLDQWLPYIDGIADEAHSLGIELGAVLSIADQQQNNFKLVRDDVLDPDTGEMMDGSTQIRSGISRLFEADLDFLVLQIGTSEFTKPSDAEVLGWLQTAIDHVADNFPGRGLHTWIHIFCGLEADGGGYFYHLPLQADPRIGAWVHTTMFYTLEHPAPVYACDEFGHQGTFLSEADGTRVQTFFPESAWWLGFDNNMPLALPLTGWSRAYDIQQSLAGHDVSGHVTFTTGREWNYWQIDHFLTRATWDASSGWDDYLAWLAPAYGSRGPEVSQALGDWTALQKRHFYDENPSIFFYLAGELAQDEIGERAGILARSPKPSYQSIYELDDVAFAAWQTEDLDMLRRMLGEYEAVLALLPAPSDGEDDLYIETYASLDITVRRIEHTIALYEAVVAARQWRLELEQAVAEAREPDGELRQALETAAAAKLGAAGQITSAVLEEIAAVERGYRYPRELLVDAKPESLTSYPFGYLAETSTAFFWTRRQEQLERFLGRAFDTSDDAWTEEPTALFVTDGSHATLVEPDNAIAAAVITSFVPQLLFGLSAVDLAAGTLTLVLAEDHNRNDLPDDGTEVRIDGALTAQIWTGDVDVYAIEVRDTADVAIGQISILDAHFELVTEDNGALVTHLVTGDLDGSILASELIGLVVNVGGIDQEGAENLLKGIYGVATDEPLPAELPMHFRFTYEKR